MKTRIRTMIVIAGLALVAGVALTQTDADRADAVLDSYLGITTFPGSVLVSQNTETEFESSASLQEIYAFIHERLVELGWERVDLTENDVEIEVRYSREGHDLSIDLEHEGDNRFDLETEFDD